MKSSSDGGPFIVLSRVSDPDPDLIRSADPDPDPYSESGSGSRRAKMTHKRRKKVKKFHVLKCRTFSFES
jgi:hypothetical protein